VGGGLAVHKKTLHFGECKFNITLGLVSAETLGEGGGGGKGGKATDYENKGGEEN